jgi:multimeric flavodoxin WrbA
MTLNKYQENLCSVSKWDFSDLKALFLNCTLKKSPELSHTEGLMNMSKAIMEKNKIKTEILRPVDYDVAYGVFPDMTEKGWDKDDWHIIQKKVMESDILIIGTPIWLGDKSSIATKVIERLYSFSGEQNDKGQYLYYNKAGGTIITGNEDGIKHVAMNLLYSLQHLGYTIPPQSDAGWIGEAGPGKSYLDEGSGGPENNFTRRNTTFMTWNIMHFARMLKDNNIPAHGNQRDKWDDGCRFDHPNPEYR